MNKILSEKQIAALVALGAGMKYRLPADLGIAPRTLQSLVRLGLAENHWHVSSLRIPDQASYRVSMAGWRIAQRTKMGWGVHT